MHNGTGVLIRWMFSSYFVIASYLGLPMFFNAQMKIWKGLVELVINFNDDVSSTISTTVCKNGGT